MFRWDAPLAIPAAVAVELWHTTHSVRSLTAGRALLVRCTPWRFVAISAPSWQLAQSSTRDTFQLDALANACAEDGNYAFLFTAPPLPITGAVGSPINPLAIK